MHMTSMLRIGLVVVFASTGCRDPSRAGAVDAAPPGVPADAPADTFISDGTPTRLPCTNSFGSALSTSYGRLDGILVAIVPPGTPGCNSDPNHVHLQVRLDGSIYDVAVNVNVDVLTTMREVAVTTMPWAEGWHAGFGISYPGLGVHAGDFTGSTTSQLVTDLIAELETVNHISVYGTGYNQSGAHLVHRNNGFDGALILRPLSNPPSVRMYRFATQTF
ncbi:MAG TPA: hypothetical protein VN253_22660 [Kofleriaceae bacterium]|nr:hypothetical protein [Kofleriaceae bacterium]